MDIFGWAKGLFGEKGLAGTITDMVEKYWPPDVSPEKKAEFTLAMNRDAMEKERNFMENAHKQDETFNKRITDLEGTATDLKTIPIVGSVMIFLRGCQRPVWGFYALYMDYMWFSNGWVIADGSQKSAAFIIINILVLGFLFGERAVQNIMPYVTQFFGVKNCEKVV